MAASIQRTCRSTMKVCMINTWVPSLIPNAWDVVVSGLLCTGGAPHGHESGHTHTSPSHLKDFESESAPCRGLVSPGPGHPKDFGKRLESSPDS